jgi:hypothetical protein
VVKPVKKQTDAISAITKYDMSFLHTSNNLNPSHFNIRYKVYNWSQKHAHLDIDSDEVQNFIENNKKSHRGLENLLQIVMINKILKIYLMLLIKLFIEYLS